ncbi:MAG: aromatic ring-hydroxylating oxygenase subunit alpha [Nocardioidaceae bacterium]
MFNQQSRAALDRAELERSLAPFGSSRMLPKAAYLDDEVLAWERQHVFDGWICLGRSDEIREPRRIVAMDTGGARVLLARDGEGTLRAFDNACRHRGHELLPCGTTASKRSIVCPYHAWTYNLDGTLRGAPGFRHVADFDPSAHGLMSIPVCEWHGWVFVDPSDQGGEFADQVGELDAILAPYEAETLRTVVTHEYEVAANWKVMVENYQECYHCSMIHPELCRVSPPESGANIETSGEWVGGWMELRQGAQTMSLDGHSGGVVLAQLSEQEQHTVMYAAVMPNLLISLHPDYVMTHLLTPMSPGVTRIVCSWAFPPAAADRADFDPSYAVDFWDLTNRQDWSACESVQRGMATRQFVPGPLAPEEDGVYHFVTLMARRYLGQDSAQD